MTKETIQNFTYRITQANKTQMIVILYDIAITYIKDAVSDIEKADFSGFRTEVNRIRDTIRELMNSVDTSIEIGHNLLRLYIFCSSELTKAYLDYDKGALYHVMSILSKLKDAYSQVSELDKSEPVMQHTESIYNGFTYNKSLKNETFVSKDVNRGFLA
ncbi:MAG: flagellar protein FliS [Lachnospiraceae bacterium]|nr:flagellar protein FliS [Lachnospiraceae bacterium]